MGIDPRQNLVLRSDKKYLIKFFMSGISCGSHSAKEHAVVCAFPDDSGPKCKTTLKYILKIKVNNIYMD